MYQILHTHNEYVSQVPGLKEFIHTGCESVLHTIWYLQLKDIVLMNVSLYTQLANYANKGRYKTPNCHLSILNYFSLKSFSPYFTKPSAGCLSYRFPSLHTCGISILPDTWSSVWSLTVQGGFVVQKSHLSYCVSILTTWWVVTKGYVARWRNKKVHKTVLPVSAVNQSRIILVISVKMTHLSEQQWIT